MSTLKVDALSSKTSNTNLTITADGSGLVDIETGFKVSGTAGVPAADIRADAITGAKIADDAIDSEHYTDGSIDNAHIADDAIDSEHYAAGSIDTAHLGDLQVTTAKIAADAITSAKIADDAIDSEHYTDGSIDNAHIADDAIDSEHYVDGSIDIAHLADDAVTLAKMAAGTDGVIITYDASGNPAHVGPGTDGQVLTSTGAGSPPAFEAAGGGAWTVISNTSIAAQANMDITGFNSSSYDHYEIWFSSGQPGTDDTRLEMETSTDGGSSFATSGYTWFIESLGEGLGQNRSVGNTTSEIMIIGNNAACTLGNAAGEFLSFRMSIIKPEDAVVTVYTWQGVGCDEASQRNSYIGCGLDTGAEDNDAVRFHMTSGNFVATGKIQFMGLASS